MHITIDVIQILKYSVATLILITLIFAPAWLAAQTRKDKFASMVVRSASWMFGWTIIGWMIGLIFASRK